ncbi:hypothetical protein [Deinococcus marmoris]|uniref:Uncharacterized protein n=1 Tax=Deinococcus marmoris TaxID=249408 RepID=A0A1U7NR29_9DEIO|nr:hypothetical protein [Deinococcus marmoris]OLV15372.1 hypothetical protein BOO71_0015172 [Deinococcus marmoris]
MTDLPDTPSTALADLLERCGKTRSEAEALAAEVVQRQRAVDPGCTWGHIYPEQIAGLWNQAAKHGKRKLVLEITADAPTYGEWTGGRVQVTVKDAQTWADYGQEQQDAHDREVN